MTANQTPLPSEVRKGPLPALTPGGLSSPRIGIGGISIESSTFSPHISGAEAFTLRTGEELIGYYDFLNPGDELREAATWLPLFHGRSFPGGAVDPEFYRYMRDTLVEAIRAEIAAGGAFDGFFFDIHGAMSVAGMEDAEGDLAAAVRQALGPDTFISTSMDLHGNVSRVLLDSCDLLTCYRMAPHEDFMETKQRAVFNMLERLRGENGADPEARRPFKAWTPIPVLLPGEKTSTRVEPAKSLYEMLPGIEALDGVIDAALWIGYAWADEPRCMAYVVVTGDDESVVREQSEAVARAFWAARDGFEFVGPVDSLSGALDSALAEGAARPYVISDSGDNPTAGGAGDVSWTLARLLEREDLAQPGRVVIHASVFDAAAVRDAVNAGLGAEVELKVGANVDDGPEGPATLHGVVHSVTHGDPDAGTQVVVRAGSVFSIITERRKPFHHMEDFRVLDLEPTTADIVMVKIGYLEPELYNLAADWTMALTPGGVDQDLLRLGHHRLQPGVFPFDPNGTPELKALVTRR